MGKERSKGEGRTVPSGGVIIESDISHLDCDKPLESKDYSASPAASNQSAHPGCLIAANTVDLN